MPLARVNGQLLHFAHVPRTGGTSVESYLAARFGPLAFLDRDYLAIPTAERWSLTSPQHIENAAFSRIIPRAWISYRFAVVRHPEDRLLSVFQYQRDAEVSIPSALSFEEWLLSGQVPAIAQPHSLDNHTRKACDLVPNDAVVFRIEDGLASLVDWLDAVEGARRGPRAIPHENGYAERLAFLGRSPGPSPEVTPKARTIITERYAEDFARFGYLPRNCSEDHALAPAHRPHHRKSGMASHAAGLPRIATVPVLHDLVRPPAGLQLLADGRVVALESAGTGLWEAVVPAGTRELRLMCRAVRPSDQAGNRDCRLLGMVVHGLEADGIAMVLPTYAEGWHAEEQESGRTWRWTDGNALLPIRTDTEPVRLKLRGLLPDFFPPVPCAQEASDVAPNRRPAPSLG